MDAGATDLMTLQTQLETQLEMNRELEKKVWAGELQSTKLAEKIETAEREYNAQLRTLDLDEQDEVGDNPNSLVHKVLLT